MSSITNSPVASLPYEGADYRAQSIVDVFSGQTGTTAFSDTFCIRGKDSMTVLVDFTQVATTVIVTTVFTSDNEDGVLLPPAINFYQETIISGTSPTHTVDLTTWLRPLSGDASFYFTVPINNRYARLAFFTPGATTDSMVVKAVLAVDGSIGR